MKVPNVLESNVVFGSNEMVRKNTVSYKRKEEGTIFPLIFFSMVSIENAFNKQIEQKYKRNF